MPAFAQSAGGLLTDEQVVVITSGIFSHWARKGILDGTNPPSYAAKTTGDATHGEVAFGTYCASCHGAEGGGTAKEAALSRMIHILPSSAIKDCERSRLPAGRNWARRTGAATSPESPMSDQEITDVVAWLASRRTQSPGQPYSAPSQAQHCGEMRMTTNPVIAPTSDATLSRRGFFMKLGILFNGLAAMVLALPIARFLLSSVARGQQRMATCRGCGLAKSPTLRKARRGWPLSAIPS